MKTFTQIREWAEARNLINGSDSFRHHIFATFSKTLQKKQNGIANQLVMPFSLS